VSSNNKKKLTTKMHQTKPCKQLPSFNVFS